MRRNNYVYVNSLFYFSMSIVKSNDLAFLILNFEQIFVKAFHLKEKLHES
jgi:hypothetical protein